MKYDFNIKLMIMRFKVKFVAGLVASIALAGSKGAFADTNIPDTGKIKPISYGEVVQKEVDIDWKNPKVKFDEWSKLRKIWSTRV